MVRRTINGTGITFCDITHSPTAVCIPFRGTNGTNGVARDRLIAKAASRVPDEIDAEAGIILPAAPPLNKLDYLMANPNSDDRMDLGSFLNLLHDHWVAHIASGYTYIAFSVNEKGAAVEVLGTSNVPPSAYQHKAVVFQCVKTDEIVECYYNTPAEASPVSQKTNDCIFKIFKSAGISDLPVGTALLVRRSILHGAPLGLTAHSLKQIFRDLAPNKRRVRTNEAIQARKRRARMNAKLSSEGVEPNNDEVLMVRVGTDQVEPCKCVIINRNDIANMVKELLGWRGGLVEYPIRQFDNHEIVVIGPAVEGTNSSEVGFLRTGVPEMYTFNQNACTMFPSLPAAALQGPVIVAKQELTGKKDFVHFDADSFRSFLAKRPTTTTMV